MSPYILENPWELFFSSSKNKFLSKFYIVKRYCLYFTDSPLVKIVQKVSQNVDTFYIFVLVVVDNLNLICEYFSNILVRGANTCHYSKFYYQCTVYIFESYSFSEDASNNQKGLQICIHYEGNYWNFLVATPSIHCYLSTHSNNLKTLDEKKTIKNTTLR